MRPLYLICILVLPGWLIGQTPDIRSYSEHHAHNGEVKLKYEFYYDQWSERNIRHGRYSEWALNGTLLLDAHYAEDQLDGLFQEWSANGRCREVSRWKAGLRHGVTSRYHREGWKETETQYQVGKKHGLETTFYASGKVKRISQYRNGDLHGFVTHYDSRGRQRSVWEYAEGRRVKEKEEVSANDYALGAEGIPKDRSGRSKRKEQPHE